MQRFIFILLLIRISYTGSAQTLGGNAAYSFVKLPATPLLTAAGGVNVSWQANEVGLTANNPSLLNASLHSQLNLSFNSFLAGIKTYGLTGAYYYEKWKTTFGGHIFFMDYGNIRGADASGNETGTFHPVDYVVQLSAGRSYLERWNYGASLKLIASNYGQYRSSALALDMGVHYTDTANGFYASVLAKNMGFQLKTYAGEGEDLPFDFQAGITKKLSKAPFAFSFTAQSLHHFNIHYPDTTFNNENEWTDNNSFFTRLMNHFVIAGHIYMGPYLEATLGYNHLRRSELNLGTGGNGLNGFSTGLRLKFSKLQVMYSRASYQRNIAYNQVGLTLVLNKFFGKGSL